MGTNVSTVDILRLDGSRALRQEYTDSEPVDAITGANDWTPKVGCFDGLRCGGAAVRTVAFTTLGGHNVTYLVVQPGETIKVAGTKVLNAGTTAIAGELHALYF